MREVAESLDVSFTSVRNYLADTRTKRRNPGPRPDASRVRTCEAKGCTNTLNPTRQQLARGHGRLCSYGCANTVRRIVPKAAPRRCAYCGETFTPGSDSAPGKYCSRSCRARAPKGDYAKARANWKTVQCTLCGKEKTVTGKGHVYRFCSKRCSNRYRWLHAIGISDDTATMKDHGRLRQQVKGRRYGPLGRGAGARGGRPVELTPEQQVRIFEMYERGGSYRQIAQTVLGNAMLKDRVYRFIQR